MSGSAITGSSTGTALSTVFAFSTRRLSSTIGLKEPASARSGSWISGSLMSGRLTGGVTEDSPDVAEDTGTGIRRTWRVLTFGEVSPLRLMIWDEVTPYALAMSSRSSNQRTVCSL